MTFVALLKSIVSRGAFAAFSVTGGRGLAFAAVLPLHGQLRPPSHIESSPHLSHSMSSSLSSWRISWPVAVAPPLLVGAAATDAADDDEDDDLADVDETGRAAEDDDGDLADVDGTGRAAEGDDEPPSSWRASSSLSTSFHLLISSIRIGMASVSP